MSLFETGSPIIYKVISDYDNCSNIEKADAFSFVLLIVLVILCAILNAATRDVDVLNYLKNNSKRLEYLKKIKKEQGFIHVNPEYTITYNTINKSSFDGFDFDYEIINTLSVNRDLSTQNRQSLYCSYVENKKLIDSVIYACKINAQKFNVYRQLLKDVPSFITYNEAFNIFKSNKKVNSCLQYERSLTVEETLNNPYNTVFHVVVRYKSPGGRNSYSNSRFYSVNSIENLKDRAIQIEKEKRQKKESEYSERQKMTASLRYDVLKRDNYKCCICGRSAKDGVKLEVDHIVPISKGGKTKLSNLRTLCNECNRGKRDKYDPHGYN